MKYKKQVLVGKRIERDLMKIDQEKHYMYVVKMPHYI